MNPAPEMKDQALKVRKMHVFKADCWGLGMIMLETCTLRAPLGLGDDKTNRLYQ